MKKVLIITALLFFAQILYSQNNNGNIVVNVENFKSSDGSLIIALFNSENSFKNKKPFKKAQVLIVNKKAKYTFKNIPYGKYTITCFHDEDDNGKLKTNLIGIPAEGVGFSNNPKMGFGPPKYKDGEFILNSENKSLYIKLIHI